jgi:hypothetical protein
MTPPVPSPTPRAAAGAAERLVAAVLVVIALLLGYVRFVVLADRPAAAVPTFDLRNPMLDARVGECHELEDSSQHPGTVSCVAVHEPGVVLRPAGGPESLGPAYERLRRMPPYLVCAVRYPQGGKGCGPDGGEPDELLLFGLNHFGVPLGISAEVVHVQPVVKRWQGRVHQTYQVQLLRHGALAGPWTVWLSEEAPVTGAVYREYAHGKRMKAERVIYREVEGCTPPR